MKDQMSGHKNAGPKYDENELQYAPMCCAWWGFTKASDRQRIDNFIRRTDVV